MLQWKRAPIGDRQYSQIDSTCPPEVMLWQELVMLRHLNCPEGTADAKLIAPWIDQAKTYFQDAHSANWRSGGLLYYYCFLNLAKAYLATKQAITVEELKTSRIQHGLSSIPHDPDQLVDFEINIHPPKRGGTVNLFASFYEVLLGEKWPFQEMISIKIRDVMAYCRDISVELANFYGISKMLVDVVSLYRSSGNKVWHELSVACDAADILRSTVNTKLHAVPYVSAEEEDKRAWYEAYDYCEGILSNSCFLRTEALEFSPDNEEEVFQTVEVLANRTYAPYLLPTPYVVPEAIEVVTFVSNIVMKEQSFRWHPMLSDYLFAFVLSTVLRYQPYMLPSNSKPSFTAEAWCNQSPISSLRYFLMALTSPSVRVKCV